MQTKRVSLIFVTDVCITVSILTSVCVHVDDIRNWKSPLLEWIACKVPSSSLVSIVPSPVPAR